VRWLGASNKKLLILNPGPPITSSTLVFSSIAANTPTSACLRSYCLCD
jgi:hypothetical protein